MLLKTVRQPVTYYRCFYMCDDPLCSPTGSEWVDEVLTPGPSWCPACDRVCELYDLEELCEERTVFEVEPAHAWPVGWREVEA
jgi:hypothetical protein